MENYSSNIKVCVDLSGPKKSLFALYNAYNQRPENVLNESTKSIMHIDTITEQALIDANKNQDFSRLEFANQESNGKLLELALWRSRMWVNGKELKIKFLGGDEYLQSKVIKYAKLWEDYANIKFTFVQSGNAEIRVSFLQGKGSWSYVGTDALNITDQSKPTMNFGWFDHSTPDIEFSRTIIHEFGHCLGCIHEHQSPEANVQWNKGLIYDYYFNTQGWSKEQVDINLFQKFDRSEMTNSHFDRDSIMLYPIPEEFTLNKFSVGWNTHLSPTDEAFVARCYPKN
jgi:serralysin